MKQILLVFMVFSFGAILAQNAIEVTGPTVQFEETTFDFGEMHQGEKVVHVFKFKNTGNEPLIISNVLVQCGCTATKWPREPIAPDSNEEIVVSFNSTGKMGMQNKTVTVVSNATNSNAIVRFTTNVLPAKAAKN